MSNEQRYTDVEKQTKILDAELKRANLVEMQRIALKEAARMQLASLDFHDGTQE